MQSLKGFRDFFPEEMADATVARQRLAFDELFTLQLELRKRRRALEENAAVDLLDRPLHGMVRFFSVQQACG